MDPQRRPAWSLFFKVECAAAAHSLSALSLMNSGPLTANEGTPESSLHEAAWAGDIAGAQKLLDHGADVNWADSIGETALFGAVAWGHAEMVRFLLSHGAEFNLSEKNGYTPLHWAASHGNLATLQALLDAGANSNALDALGRRPIDVARKHGKGEHVAHLKGRGAA
ncbi:hypothetical protein B0B52_07695 [Polaromonas sp. A23]|nr:hypothetical protein B0B52_07695 [Polaromonas sp. A23]